MVQKEQSDSDTCLGDVADATGMFLIRIGPLSKASGTRVCKRGQSGGAWRSGLEGPCSTVRRSIPGMLTLIAWDDLSPTDVRPCSRCPEPGARAPSQRERTAA